MKYLFILSGVVCLSFMLLPACAPQAEQVAALEAMKEQSKVEEQNEKIAKQLFVLIDAQDFEGLNEVLADDFALAVPGQPKPLSKDMLFQLIKTHYTAFPDWIHVIEDVIADGDKVAVKLTQNGTHEAEYEGIPATGIKATLAAMHIGTIVDGKIKDWFVIEDYLGFYMQLGMEMKPKEETT